LWWIGKFYYLLKPQGSSKLGSGAKPATPCEDRQRRKINCSLQNALVEKAAWCVARWHAGLAPKVTFASKFGEKERQIEL